MERCFSYEKNAESAYFLIKMGGVLRTMLLSRPAASGARRRFALLLCKMAPVPAPAPELKAQLIE
jgi:hypothetical protein